MTAPFHAIGIDIGGTKIAAGLVAFPHGQVLRSLRTPTRPECGGNAVLDDVLGIASSLKTDAAAEGIEVRAIGVGICELVSPDGQVISGNCVDWRSLPAAARLSTVAPTLIEADVRAAALAEALFGAGRGLECFLYITVGTGISCSLVIGGVPLTGARGATGTMASTPWGLTCPNCGKADPRSIEQIASGPALIANYNSVSTHPATTAHEVLAAAASGDPAAASTVRSAGEALGAAMAMLINVTDPQAVVIGGGLGLTAGAYRQALTDSARSRVWWEGHRQLPILQAETGADAGLLGAAASAWKRATPFAPIKG